MAWHNDPPPSYGRFDPAPPADAPRRIEDLDSRERVNLRQAARQLGEARHGPPEEFVRRLGEFRRTWHALDLDPAGLVAAEDRVMRGWLP